jgi:tripartite-type tricarboxylate transporter receptor subunit TctC
LAVTSSGRTLAQPEDYPRRTIKIVVPFPPGGPVDVVARLLAPRLQSILGQPVVMEHRGGAGGAIGTRAVASAPPDGYTLLLTSASLTVTPAVSKKAGYDAVQSFAPIAQVSESCLVLAVPANAKNASLASLIAQARQNPGQLNYGSPGPGNLAHLTAELFKLNAMTDVVHVPFKGGGEMVTALLGRQIDFAFPDISIALPLIREGRLRALGITGATRKPELPETPTLAESGLPDVVVAFWAGLAAPAGTPRPVVERLNAAVKEAVQTADLRASLANFGAETRTGSPDDFAHLIAADMRRWSKVASAAGISLD